MTVVSSTCTCIFGEFEMQGITFTEDSYECCFCVWLTTFRAGRVANLTDVEQEAWQEHLIVVHDYEK